MIEKLTSLNDLKEMNIDELEVLSDEIRGAILNKVSKVGGHLGSNLGIVECTIALHYVFDSPKDKLIFDVSHQTYTHKILTGRKQAFLEEEHFKDISNFSDFHESEHDLYKLGHTSTAISLGIGEAMARDLKKENYNVISIIGDGALGGGEALAALNTAGEFKNNLIIVLNDNQMSIVENHGYIYKNLEFLRETKGKYDKNIFSSFGLDYLYVENGNDIKSLIEAFKKVKDINHPIVVHISTVKGKGYSFAENSKRDWHSTPAFDLKTGQKKNPSKKNYLSITREFIMKSAMKYDNFAYVTSSAPYSAGLSKEDIEALGDKYLDVGIEEDNAVTIASGLAKRGIKTIFSTNSSFLQRAYDQLVEDVALNNSPVVILVNGGSIKFMNADTHLGIFDISFLSNIPNLDYLCPVSLEEFNFMLEKSLNNYKKSIAIRIPYGEIETFNNKNNGEFDKYEIYCEGKDVALLALGNTFKVAKEVCDFYKENGKNLTLINPRSASILDKEVLNSLLANHKCIITLEDGIISGGFGEHIANYYSEKDIKVINLGYKKEFYNLFNFNDVLKEAKMDFISLKELIEKL